MGQIINSLIKWAIFFGILYLIFTNFTTFLIIILVIFALAYYAFYKLKKKIQENNTNGFRFTFNGQEFSNAGGFNFNGFEEQFKSSGFNTTNSLGEVSKAKEFFGFTHEPSRDEIKKKYKELAKKYHPDVNDHDDSMMKQLNHYKDILLKIYTD